VISQNKLECFPPYNLACCLWEGEKPVQLTPETCKHYTLVERLACEAKQTNQNVIAVVKSFSECDADF
jgi:hypothetical protein